MQSSPRVPREELSLGQNSQVRPNSALERVKGNRVGPSQHHCQKERRLLPSIYLFPLQPTYWNPRPQLETGGRNCQKIPLKWSEHLLPSGIPKDICNPHQARFRYEYCRTTTTLRHLHQIKGHHRSLSDDWASYHSQDHRRKYLQIIEAYRSWVQKERSWAGDPLQLS